MPIEYACWTKSILSKWNYWKKKFAEKYCCSCRIQSEQFVMNYNVLSFLLFRWEMQGIRYRTVGGKMYHGLNIKKRAYLVSSDVSNKKKIIIEFVKLLFFHISRIFISTLAREFQIYIRLYIRTKFTLLSVWNHEMRSLLESWKRKGRMLKSIFAVFCIYSFDSLIWFNCFSRSSHGNVNVVCVVFLGNRFNTTNKTGFKSVTSSDVRLFVILCSSCTFYSSELKFFLSSNW